MANATQPTIAKLAHNYHKSKISREDITLDNGRTVGIIITFDRTDTRLLLSDINGKIFRFEQFSKNDGGKEVWTQMLNADGRWTTAERSVFEDIEEAAHWTEDCNA